VVKRLYGDTAVTHIGRLALKAVRQEMVKLGWARSHINPQAGRIRRMFKWGVKNEMVPPSILHGLQAVAGLRRGKTEAREREPVRPVPETMVYAIKGHVARQVWAMIELQLLAGMRPDEVSRIRAGDVDTSGRLWVYSPIRHKTQDPGHGPSRLARQRLAATPSARRCGRRQVASPPSQPGRAITPYLVSVGDEGGGGGWWWSIRAKWMVYPRQRNRRTTILVLCQRDGVVTPTRAGLGFPVDSRCCPGANSRLGQAGASGDRPP
jgi:hypothetical protein